VRRVLAVGLRELARKGRLQGENVNREMLEYILDVV
jgi:hypothetical protein